jgi:signal transduction histidine kinase/ligand-binding sensor domain-containing protein
LQDSKGFIWFGTQDGLNRYDGYEFVVYKHDPEDPDTLSNNFIWALYEDESGTMWIGTGGGGLDSFDRVTGHFTHYQRDPNDPHSLSSNIVLSIHQDREGTLWLGTNGGGLNRLDRESGQFANYQNDPDDPHSLGHNAVQSIHEDQEGVLWIGTNGGGLDRLDRESGQFVHYQHDPDDPHSLSSNAVLSILSDREGRLWIGTNGGGLDRLDRESVADPSGAQFVHYQHDPNNPDSLSDDQVWAVCEDRGGTLWIGTFGGGLDRFDREMERFIHYRNDPDDPQSLSNDQIWSLYGDQVGALWIGTFGGGVNRLDPQIKFDHYQSDPNDPNSLSENVVWSFYQDQERVLWIGTNGGGLNRLDPESTSGASTVQFVHYRHVPTDTQSLGDDVVWSIYQDQEGVLWLGTSSGLDRFDRETEQFNHYPAAPIFTIHEDREDVLWIGTWGGGLGQFDRKGGQFTFYQNDPANAYSLSSNSVVSIHEDQEGVLWLGTFDGGLNEFDRETGRFAHHQNDPNDPTSLSHNTVLSIFGDEGDTLWIGTGGGGLNKFDVATKTFTAYREKDGLPNDTVYGILQDDAPSKQGGPHLWLSTNRGLSKFNPQTETFRNYDAGDGLQSNEFNQGSYYKSASGTMFFGGINGFNAFAPEGVADNPYIPPIVLTALTQGGESPDVDTSIDSVTAVTFKWPRNFFEFEFAALNYSQPEKNQYAYMLEGFDPDWIETGSRRFGQYTNLPGGAYTLRLKGSNNDGIWNEQGYSLQVAVVPPFWQTWWFRGIVALALVGMVLGSYRLRVRNIEARSNKLQIQVANRTRELAALNAVTTAASRSLDLQQILDDALSTTLDVTGTESGGIYLLDEKEEVLTLATHRGFSSEHVAEIDGLGVGEGFSGYVVQSGQPLVVKDVSADPRLTRMAARDEGLHSMVCVPLTSKEKVLGTLFAVTRGFREFSEQDVLLLMSISHQIGAALENARLYEDANTRLAQVTALQETTKAVASTLDLDNLLSLIIQQASTLLQADGGIINLVDWEKQVDQVVAACGLGTSLLGRRSALEGSLSGWATLHNESVISNRVPADSRVYQPALSWVTAGPIQSAAIAPLTVKEQVMGTLVVMGTLEGKKEFAPPDLDLLVAFANQAATAIENAQLFEAERQRADELDALRTTMADVTAELELSALLQAIVERAAGLLDATGGEFGLYDESSQELRIVVSYNLGKDYVGTRHTVGQGAMGLVVETGESLIIDDYQTWEGALEQYGHIHATLATPLKVGNRLVGVFTTVTGDPDRQFTSADLHLLNLFAQQAAIAIENARLYEQAQQLAVMEERQRLARDLHDSVTQALYGMMLYSEAAAEELTLRQLDIVAEYLRELRQTAQEALAEMRLLIHELRPPVLAEEGLVPALQARLQAVEGRAGLKTEFSAEMEDRLPPQVEEGLYRIAQEALNNALKHAQASTIAVHLHHIAEEGVVILEITDDGTGFDPAAVAGKGGLGLSAMEERAAELGGRLTVESGTEGGTRVRLEVSA